MLLELSGDPANPSSVHFFGKKARSLLLAARETCASFFFAKPEEILFTSGGTESINYFLRGLGPKGHIITTSIEHSAIHQTLKILEGAVSYLPVGLWGAPSPEQIEEAIRPDTRAIVLSFSNAETGVKIDLASIAAMAERRGIPLFIDAVASIGKEPLLLHPGISAIALSAHKFHGPKGIGALYLKSSMKLLPGITGGGQEYMRRAGTENLAGILGLAKALEILKEKQGEITLHITTLRQTLESGLKREVPDMIIHGEGPRISNTSNIAFLGVDAETLLMQLDLAGIAASHGSACSSGALEPSRILINMGIDRKIVRSSIRFSLSRMNTQKEIEIAIEKIAHLVKSLRKISR